MNQTVRHTAVAVAVAVALVGPAAAGVDSAPYTPRSAGRLAELAAPQRPATDVGGTIAPGTVWNLAGSPYRVVSDSVVPAGVTLTIEPGVEVRMTRARTVRVEGSVQAQGTEDQPIVVTADFTAEPWNSWVMEAASGPSRFEHVHFSHNGARRTAMLEILTDNVVVTRCRFHDGGASAIDVRDASPVIERSTFRAASALSLTPPGALRIRGRSAPVVALNFFQSNPNAPIYLDATASPKFDGNRFELNGWDGASIAGSVTGEVRLSSLGPRRWGYWVDAGGLAIEQGATLTIEAGTSLRFISNGLLVFGTLRAEGKPGAKVAFTSDDNVPQPGSWRDITFFPSSTPYDPATGTGSMIDHAVIEYGGSQSTGALQINGSSPRISNVSFRELPGRGVTVSGEAAAPLMEGNWFEALDAEDNGTAVFASGGARPVLRFNVFQDNGTGVEASAAAQPHVGPYNRFDRNAKWGVINNDATVCVPATLNEWGAPEGPDDASGRDDACGLGTNNSLGDIVSDHVGYQPWAGTLPRPYLTAPRCGLLRNDTPRIEGMAPPGSTVVIYDNYEVLGEATAAVGPGALEPFVFDAPALTTGSHVFSIRATDGEMESGVSDPVELLVDPTAFINAAGLHLTYDLDGIHYALGLSDADGCTAVGGGEWEVRIHPDTDNPNIAALSTLHVPVECPAGTPTVTLQYNDTQMPMTLSGEGVATATFDPGTGGQLGIEISCGDATRFFSLGVVSLEFDGFVYNGSSSLPNPPRDARIAEATVTLYQADVSGASWSIWDASAWFGQSNPQVTGPFGWYGFYPPPGLYRAEVVHADFDTFVTGPVRLGAEPFMETIALGGARLVYLPDVRLKQ